MKWRLILFILFAGLLSWDVSDCLVDLEKELAVITEQAPEGEEARYGEFVWDFYLFNGCSLHRECISVFA